MTSLHSAMTSLHGDLEDVVGPGREVEIEAPHCKIAAIAVVDGGAGQIPQPYRAPGQVGKRELGVALTVVA